MQLQGYEISAETGMIGLPERIVITDDENLAENTVGYDVTFLLNGAIDINDYVKLVSKKITGYFYVYSLNISGDNVSGDWFCKARLIELQRFGYSSEEYTGTTVAPGTGIAQTDMYIRSGPGTDYSIVGVVHQGSTVDILEVTSNNWLKIRCGNTADGYGYTSNAGGKYYIT